MDKLKETSYYHLKIKEWPIEERPREKLLRCGSQSLSDAELIALLIGSGTGGITAVDLAKRLLVEYSNLSTMACSEIQELIRMKGIGTACAARLLASFELGRRIESGGIQKKMKITSPEDIGKVYLPLFRHMKKEVFKIILLDSANRIIRDVTISQGILNSSVVHPREVFKSAVDHMAAGIILLHNHPSGEKLPSSEDKRVTNQICGAGEVMGIPVLDHIILAGDRFFSFADHGLLSQ